eukprot:8906090-Pyramimonas_sp.AAC.1
MLANELGAGAALLGELRVSGARLGEIPVPYVKDYRLVDQLCHSGRQSLGKLDVVIGRFHARCQH